MSTLQLEVYACTFPHPKAFDGTEAAKLSDPFSLPSCLYDEHLAMVAIANKAYTKALAIIRACPRPQTGRKILKGLADKGHIPCLYELAIVTFHCRPCVATLVNRSLPMLEVARQLTIIDAEVISSKESATQLGASLYQGYFRLLSKFVDAHLAQNLKDIQFENDKTINERTNRALITALKSLSSSGMTQSVKWVCQGKAPAISIQNSRREIAQKRMTNLESVG